MWRKVGIEADIEVYEIAKHFELRTSHKLAPLAFYNWGNAIGDPSTSTGHAMFGPSPHSSWKSDDLDANDPREPDCLPHNLVLSYQYACRLGGREWTGIVYTRAGARIRFPDLGEADLANYPKRIRFADLLGGAISAGIGSGHLRKWPKHLSQRRTGPARICRRWRTSTKSKAISMGCKRPT